MSFDPTGYTLAHEHLHIDLSGFKNNVDCRLDQYAFICQEMNDLMARGVRNVIEMTNRYMGRNAQFMLDVMRETGINVVACTGYYQDAFFPEHVATRSVQELAQERMEQNAQTLLETFPDSGRTGYLLRRTFDEVTQVVDELYDELSVSAFRPEFCELEFSARGALPGVAFSGKRCRGVVEGFVDRVDVWQSGGRPYVRVVDYKSGAKAFRLADIVNGLNLQMFLYLFNVCADGSNPYAGVPAGVLYMHAARSVMTVETKSSAEKDIAGQEDKAFGMNGIVITNPDCDIPAAMEHDLAGKYIPVRLKKSGVGGSLASLEQLGLLQRKIEALVADMGNALQNGQIGQRPVQAKDHDKTCEYCDFASVCAFKKSVTPRTYDDQTDSAVLAELEKEGESHA